MIREIYWKIEPLLRRPASRIYEKRAMETLREDTDLRDSEILEILRYAEKLAITSREYVEHGYWRFSAEKLEKIRNERGHRWQLAEHLAAEAEDLCTAGSGKGNANLKKRALEIERDMLDARFNNEVRTSEYEIMKWHQLSAEQRRLMLTKRHSRELNHKYRRPGYIMNGTRDKALFNRHFQDMLGRNWFESDGLSFEKFASEIQKFRTDSFFFKPVFGSMGVEVRKFNFREQNLHRIYRQIRHTHGVIEESISQHQAMQSLCSDCVNTVRIASLVDFDGEVHSLWGSCRVGCGDGQPVDNASQGGLRVSVNLASGKMDSMAVDVSGAAGPGAKSYTAGAKLIERHPVTGTVFMDFQIPYWKEVLSLVDRAAVRALSDFGLGFVGWDIAITPTGPVIIEGNNCPAVATIQYPRLLQYGEGMEHIVRDWI